MTNASRPIRMLVVPADDAVPVYVAEAPATGVEAVLHEVIGARDIDPMRFDVRGDCVVLVCGDTGDAEELPRNSRATALWHRLDSHAAPDELLGTVVLVGATDDAWRILPAGAVDADAEMWRSVPVTVVRWARALG